jgi:hypothetical protein
LPGPPCDLERAQEIWDVIRREVEEIKTAKALWLPAGGTLPSPPHAIESELRSRAERAAREGDVILAALVGSWWKKSWLAALKATK